MWSRSSCSPTHRDPNSRTFLFIVDFQLHKGSWRWSRKCMTWPVSMKRYQKISLPVLHVKSTRCFKNSSKKGRKLVFYWKIPAYYFSANLVVSCENQIHLWLFPWRLVIAIFAKIRFYHLFASWLIESGS